MKPTGPTPVLRTPISRRAALRGLAYGAAVTIPMPMLEAMLPRRAAAQGQVRRFVGVYVPNGFGSDRAYRWADCSRDRWTPQNTGPSWVATRFLRPFTDRGMKPDITVLSNVDMPQSRSNAHEAWMLLQPFGRGGSTGGNYGGMAGGRTIDYAIGDAIGAQTKFKTLDFGVVFTGSEGGAYISYTGASAPVTPQNNPAAMFDRVFAGGAGGGGGASSGGGASGGGTDPALERLRADRRSVLDGIKANLALLQGQIGSADRQRLQAHLDAIRGIETRLTSIGGGSGSGGSGGGGSTPPPPVSPAMGCGTPARVTAPHMDENQIPALMKAQTDMLVMALTCDLTRSATLVFGGAALCSTRYLHLGVNRGRHDVTHDQFGANPEATDLYNSQVVADVVAALKAVPEGGRTLLHNTAVFGFTECAGGAPHNFGGSNWRNIYRDGSPPDGAYILAGMHDYFKSHGSHLRYNNATGNNIQILYSLYEAVTGQDPATWMTTSSQGPLPGLRGEASTTLMNYPNAWSC